jgi:hypothetical protein
MRRIGLAGVVLLGVAIPAGADEIYRWKDKGGNVHFSNAPTVTEGSGTVSSEVMPSAPPGAATQGAPGVAAVPDEEAGTFSTEASLRRSAIERDLRAAQRRLDEIDGQLATLARARTRFAGGTEATGGVGTNADAFRSEEETTLEKEREQLLDRRQALRADAAKLEAEVTSRLGGTPEWWRAVR